MKTLGDRVKARRLQLGFTQSDLAERVTHAGFEIGQSAVSTIESKGDSNPLCLQELAIALNTEVEWLRNGTELPPMPAKPAKGAPYSSRVSSTTSSAVGDEHDVRAYLEVAGKKIPFTRRAPRTIGILIPDVPKLRMTSFGGVLVGTPPADPLHVDNLMAGYLNPYIVGRAPRTPAIANRSSVFAIDCPGPSMVPWRQAGELLYVDPKATVYPGMHVLVVLNDPDLDGIDDYFAVMAARLGRPRDQTIELFIYNPPQSLVLQRNSVRHMWAIIEWPRLVSNDDGSEE
jgi:hypothetical protein